MFEKAKKTWVENMTHLCVFPIVYMLWMLVGLFAFKQFFGAKSPEGTFLTLLCKSTENGGGFTKSLSVILIFCIVIYTMMQAIKYAMTKGAGTGLLAPAAQKMIDRAGKLQKNLTSGVYEKSKSLARVAATPLVYAKDGALNTARRGTSFLSNKVADRFGRRAEDAKGELGRKFYTSLSSKFRNPKLFGQTQEDAEKARTKGEEEKYNKYVQVLKDSGAFKIEGEKAWLKKNGGTAADYKKYADERAERIMRTQLGDSIMNADNGSGVIHKDAILADMYDVEKDASGAIISQKFNEAKLWKSIDAAAKYHTTGDGKDVLDAKKAQAKRMGLAGMSLVDYKHLRAGGQIDALRASRAELGSKANKKQSKIENLKRKEKDVIRMQSKLQFMPTEANIELVVSSPDFRLNQNEYNKKVREFQQEYVKSNDLRLTADQRTAAKSKADRLKREVDEERSKAEERLAKLKDEVINLSAEEEA